MKDEFFITLSFCIYKTQEIKQIPKMSLKQALKYIYITIKLIWYSISCNPNPVCQFVVNDLIQVIHLSQHATYITTVCYITVGIQRNLAFLLNLPHIFWAKSNIFSI